MKIKLSKPRIGIEPQRIRTAVTGSWRDGKTTAERGYGSRWQRAREAHLRRHPLCVYCFADGYVTPATIVDHKVPHRGDMALFWDESNWQSMCQPHHDGVKKSEDAAHG